MKRGLNIIMDNKKVNAFQFTLIVSLFTIGSSILIIPSSLTADAKQSAWMAAITGLLIGILVVRFYTIIACKYPDLTLVQVSEKVMGKWIGKFSSLTFIIFIFILGSLILRNIGDFLTTQIMPETPIHAIHFIFLLIVIYGTRLGIETIGRLAELLFPWVIFFFVVFVFSISPQVKIDNIQPFFEGGSDPFLRSTITFVSVPFMELVVLLMFTPMVNRLDRIKRSLVTGTIIGGLFLIIIVMLSILVLGSDITARNLYPSYALAKMINIGDFLQRIEVIMAWMWFISIFFNLVLCFYATALGLAQIFHVQDYRILTIPLGMVMQVISVIAYPNTAYFLNFFPKIWLPYTMTFSLFFPFLIWFLDAIKGKIKSKNS